MRYIHIETPGPEAEFEIAIGEPVAPGPGQIQIEVHFAGVNRPDVIQRLGFYPPPPGASPILGLEVSGVVSALGEGVTDWQLGDQVCALTNGGGYAESVCVDAGQCLPVPEGLSLQEAAALPETCFTVWTNVFDRAGLIEGESILIHAGASGIGSTAIQMAKAMGAIVYTTASSQQKCDSCRAMGADLSINYHEQDFVEVIKAQTEGRGVDVILDMVGGDYMQRNMSAAAVEGRIVNIAYLRGPKAELNMMPVMLKRLTLTGSTLRPQSDRAKAGIANNLRNIIWPHIEAGNIKPLIAEAFPLDRVSDAHQLMESNRLIGKIVLAVKL